MSIANECGFHNTPTSKIARKAGFSEATIYKNFINKEDLIVEVYLKIKSELVEYVFYDFEKSVELKENSRYILNRYIDYFLNNVEELKYYLQFTNSNYMDRIVSERGIIKLQPLVDLINYGIEQKKLKDMPIAFYHAFVHMPILEITRSCMLEEVQMTPEFKSQVVENIINIIFIE